MPGFWKPLLPTENNRNPESLSWCWSRSGCPDFWEHLCPAHSELWIHPDSSVYCPKAAISNWASTPPPLSHACSVGGPASFRKSSLPGKFPQPHSPPPLCPLLSPRLTPPFPEDLPFFPTSSFLSPRTGFSCSALKDTQVSAHTLLCLNPQPIRNLSLLLLLHFRPLERRYCTIISLDNWGNGDRVDGKFSIEKG